MSDADVRPAPTRGRSTTRGGRGGFSRGGPRGGRKVNGTSTDPASMEESLEDQGEIGEMKKKYSSELSMLKEMFSDWTDTDLVFALQEADGDVPATVDKITQGAVSQFAEVKKPKDRARSKAKEEPTTAGATEKPAFAARGGRGRGGFEGSRGGRGRGSERGRGGHRGGRGGHATANGTAKDGLIDSVPTTESNAWDTSANASSSDAGAWGTATATTTADGGWDTAAPDAAKAPADASQSAWGNVVTAESTPAAASEGAKSSLIPEGGPKKSWASMFAKPKPAPAPVPQKQILTKPQPPPAELVASGQIPPAAAQQPATEELKDTEPAAPALSIQEPEQPATVAADIPDPLTEENVEHLPDESHPPATNTVASTTGSIDPRNLTPLPAQQAPIGRPPMGGFATSANRLAGTGGRSASFQRRVQEQQEAVVMPGHNAMDRAAVQFGSMGLNGEPGPDVDEEREEPETRLPPQHSPPSQPRTSLPPAPRQAAGPQELSGETAVPTPKQAPGLPPASVQNQQQMLQEANMGQNLPQEQQMNQGYSQYGRYGQQDSGAQQKPYDPFGHQAQHSQYDQFGGHAQPQPQQQAPAGFGGLSSAPSDYSSYYTSDQSRAYNQYYGSSFGVHDGRGQLGQPQGQQDAGAGPQRSTSGFGAMPHEASSSFVSQAPQAASRFAEAPGSGHNTPNPPIGAQQQPAQQLNAQQSQHSMHQPQGHQQGAYGGNAAAAAAAAAGYPYGHPYYSSPYQQAYQNQFGYSHQAGGYGGGYPAKQGSMYGGPHGYGMGSQSSYDQHSSSPANAGAFAQNQQSSMRSASGMGSGLGGLDDYSRGSQAGSHQQSGGFGAMNDPFARTTSGFGTQGYGQQSMTAGPEDSLKPFNESKSGPSPALGQPGRPGSAANSAGGNTQSGLPPPQNQSSGFGGYPGFPGQGSQYGGLGGLGSHQQGHGGMGGQSAYGGYGGFNQTYGGYGASRGGWGANYGGH